MATEDAAVLLADFVSSLDNLPSEVCHILEEIGHKEGRVSDLRSRATQRDQALQKHARPVAQGGQGLLVPNPKEESSVKKIRLDLDAAEATTKEKIALADRGVNLLSRHLNRLQAQLELLTSTVPPLPTLPSFTPALPTATPTAMYSAQPTYTGTPGGTSGYNPFAQQFAGTPATPGGLQDRRKSSLSAGTPMQVPLLPAQLAAQGNLPGSAGGYPFAQTPGAQTPGTPIGGAASSRRAGPSRLQNIAYASPAPPGTPQALQQQLAAQQAHLQQQQQHQQQQQQQQPNLAFMQQQQHLQQQQQLLARAQAQALAQHQMQNQQQMMQAAEAQQRLAQQQQQQLQQQQAMQAQQAAAHAAGNKRKRQEEDKASAREEESVEAEGEDATPYCFCQRPSFGEMIGCDAPDCKIEWFHLGCIGLKESPEGSWICSMCEQQKLQKQGQGRAGRKR
ncbi:hypothetical protein JCM8547_002358 [Rhodosporidiobolus lusitaniae]